MNHKPRHPSIQRLFRAAAEIKDLHTAAEIGRLLDVTEQTINNWAYRGDHGISKEGALKAQEVLGVSAVWLRDNIGTMRPPRGGKVSPEMQAVIDTLIQIDAIGGSEREDTLYFINRLLRKDDRQKRNVG